MKILIIEDDKLTINALEKSLSNNGHNVSTVRSGEEGLEALKKDKFDVLLCDIMMPGLSGLSFVTVVRTVVLCETPIIMMSTLHNTSLLDAAFTAGANDFINKPFTENELSAKLNKFQTVHENK